MQIGDIAFRVGGESIRSVNKAVLASADTVSVTYRTQKNGDCGVTVTQHRTNAKLETGLCPVRALAGLISRTTAHLRAAVIHYGEARLGFLACRAEHRDALPSSGRGYGNPPGRRASRDNSVDWVMAEPDIHALPCLRIQIQQMRKGVTDVMNAIPDSLRWKERLPEPILERCPRFIGGRPGPGYLLESPRLWATKR